jgi:biotin carboxylase
VLLLFASTTGYQIRVFADAARRLGAGLALATDRCHVLDDPWGDHALPVRFDRVAESLAVLRERGLKVDGVAAVGDLPAVLAAAAAEMYGVPFHSYASALACHNKRMARRMLGEAGLRVPWYSSATEDLQPPFPCVLKPIGLSASRGVIRANNHLEYLEALRRIKKMGEHEIQVESYIPGREFAVEGLVTNGALQAIAIFDKPDPLEGPYFEETIYVTPSREPVEVQQALIGTAAQAVHALGLRHGPVHVELRFNETGAWMLEAHARPIGGLCARALRLSGGVPLEEAILRHALGEDVSGMRLEEGASAVMMIPIPKGGIYHSVEGVERAREVCGIEDVIVTATEGQHLVPLPEGATYLGFIFARAATPEGAEAALRRSHARLEFRIATALETLSPSS